MTASAVGNAVAVTTTAVAVAAASAVATAVPLGSVGSSAAEAGSTTDLEVVTPAQAQGYALAHVQAVAVEVLGRVASGAATAPGTKVADLLVGESSSGSAANSVWNASSFRP